MSRLSPGSRRVLIRVLYLIVEAGLIAGAFVDPLYWQWVVWFSIFHAALFLVLFGWCPLSRMIYLFPWNREAAFTPQLFMRTFFSGPQPGRFKVAAAPLSDG